MSIFNPNTTNVGGRLINQEWDAARQAKHMVRALEEKEVRAADRAAEARANNDPAVIAEREKRLAAEAELKAEKEKNRAMENARNHDVYIANGGFFGMMGRAINFLIMLASGAALAFCILGAVVLAANNDFTVTVLSTLGVVAGFSAVVLALTVRKFRKPLKS